MAGTSRHIAASAKNAIKRDPFMVSLHPFDFVVDAYAIANPGQRSKKTFQIFVSVFSRLLARISLES
jgi:hypothetical protein